MVIKNVEVYGLRESIVRSGYPMLVGEVPDLDVYGHSYSEALENKHRADRLARVRPGTGHDNFLKGIIVQFDMKYPEYFSPQIQRYHWIDIISSQSKMHRITARELTKDDFTSETSKHEIEQVNTRIKVYNALDRKDKTKEMVFNSIISNLPSGYMKWMGISTNYLQLKTIYNQRRHHKLTEWKVFCDWIETLPQSELIITKNN